MDSEFGPTQTVNADPENRSTMPNKRPNPPENEISWRTEELGPEMRRKLFEKLVPSASPGSRRDGPAPANKDEQHSERAKAPKQSRK